MAALFEDFYALGVGEPLELAVDHEVEPFGKLLVEVLGEESDVVGAMVEGIFHAIFDEVFGELHVVFDVVEGHFGLDHPELRQMARSVGVFGAECGAEGIDAAEGRCSELAFELAGDGERRHLAEEILRIVDRTVFELGKVVERQGRYLELRSGAFTVGGRDQRGVEIVEAAVVEEFMHGESEGVAYAEHSPEGVGARAEVGLFAQELEGVPFLLQRVGGGVGCAVDLKLGGLHLDALSFSARGHELSLHVDARSGGHRLELLFGSGGKVEHDLEVLDRGAVVERHELHVFVAAARADPSLHVDFLADKGFGIGEDLLYG